MNDWQRPGSNDQAITLQQDPGAVAGPATLDTDIDRIAAVTTQLQQFVRFAAHDLRAPLRTIHGYSQLMAESLDASMTEDQHRYLEQLRSRSHAALKLIDALWALTLSETNQLATEEVDLGLMLADVLAERDHDVATLGIDLEVEPLPTIEASSALIRQLLVNLIDNAIKFAGPDPSLRAEVIAEDPTSVTLALTNRWSSDQSEPPNGPVTPSDGLDLFEAGVRGERQVEGGGIGLSICRKVVELHNGRIWIEPGPPNQFGVRVQLPRTSPATTVVHELSGELP